MAAKYFKDSIFWIEVDKILPNPYQPRKDFDQMQLQSLSDSIKQYGVLQALVVTRKDVEKADGGMSVEYELIAGERRLRASKLAGLTQVPCLIQTGIEDNNQLKLELAIIENLQREDLNPVDRAKSFKQLVDEFSMTHAKVAEKVGKSREYVSNSLRLLQLPEEIMQAVVDGKIAEGHARSLLMLVDKPAEQSTLFKEIMFKKLTVRETEQISRKVAHDKTRKKDARVDPDIIKMEEKFSESLGTRVHIEKKKTGGKILIDFFSDEDLQEILNMLKNGDPKDKGALMKRFIENGGAEKLNEPIAAPSIAEAIEETTGIVIEEDNEVKPAYYQPEPVAPAAQAPSPEQNVAPAPEVVNQSESLAIKEEEIDHLRVEAAEPQVSVPSYTEVESVQADPIELDPQSQEQVAQPQVVQEQEKDDDDDDDVFSMDKFTI